MRNGIYFCLLVAAFVLACLAAYWHGRRLRTRAQNAIDLRYQQLRFVLVIWSILFVLQVAIAFQRHGQPLLNKLAVPGWFALCFGIFLFLLLRTRRQLRSRPDFVQHKRKPLPQFFWQAVLILLPVAGLAGFGLYSLRQDRLLAEQEAHESGQILAQHLADAIGTEGAKQLRDYREACFGLHANRTADLGLSQWAGGAATESNAWQRIKEWQQANPEIDLAAQPPSDGSVKVSPESLLPQPPHWLAELNAEQRQLWQAAKQAEFSSHDDSAAMAAIQKFIESIPPKGARANADYLLLLAQTRGLATQPAVSQMADFSRAHWGSSSEPSDAGVPLGQLICYQALRRLPDGAGLPEGFVRYTTVSWMIEYCPSMFSPALIAETRRVLRGTAQEPYAGTLKAWWDANAVAREILDDFRDQHPTNTWDTASFWVNSRAGKFLLILGDRWNAPTNSVPPPPASYQYLMIPQTVVEKALAGALTRPEISLPPYAKAEFEIAGKEINLRQVQTRSNSNSPLPLIGQAAGTWKDLPLNLHAYPFRVRVSLASPEILYARQRQRTLLFGALIVASAVAAAMGLFAAWRSFRRQQELSELKTNFVSSVSHELRAPIASVRLMAENLERGKISEPAKQGEYFRFIVQECCRLSSLIENVLDFSRIEQGRKQYEFEPTNLVALVETTVKLMEPYAAEKGVRLETAFRLPPSAFRLELIVDGRAIQQALVNLIDNAVKHSPKGETVTVEIESRKQKAESRNSDCEVVCVSVADHGPGIPAAEHEKIFERFYRLGSELRRETQGVGIGLSVVKHIIVAHGGRVIVQSEPGKGSRFTIELPPKL